MSIWNITEQPWTLVAAGILVLIGLWLFRDLLKRKVRLLWLLPLLIGGAGFALDRFIETDIEQVRTVITKAVKAAEKENGDAIGALVSESYRDSYHRSKRMLMSHCNSVFSEPLILKNVERISAVRIESPKATVDFTVRVVFDPAGSVYEFQKQMMFRLQAELGKEGGRWLISKVEILQINLVEANWSHLQDAP